MLMEETRKIIADFTVVENRRLTDRFTLLTFNGPVPEGIRPGQFVLVRVDGSASTFLRRPISINDANAATGSLTLLVRRAGDGSNRLCDLPLGARVNMILPLGNGFTLPENPAKSCLLVGGGVGVAPLYMLGKEIKARGGRPTFLLAARTREELLLVDRFAAVGDVLTITDDGSDGEKGFAHNHSALAGERRWDMVYCCGPAPMMKGVARAARNSDSACEVSLENMMACGLGACLCCVENTVKGNVCVCTEGPVFNINQLTWE